MSEAIRRRLPDVYVSASHELEFREFERTSTVAANAFVGPIMIRYLTDLRDGVRRLSEDARLSITQSNGVAISVETAVRQPIRTALSRPAAGVVGAAAAAADAGCPDAVTFDVGGTSSDVALIDGSALTERSSTDIDGLAIRSRMLDIHTVGAGGGSIATVDAGGRPWGRDPARGRGSLATFVIMGMILGPAPATTTGTPAAVADHIAPTTSAVPTTTPAPATTAPPTSTAPTAVATTPPVTTTRLPVATTTTPAPEPQPQPRPRPAPKPKPESDSESESESDRDDSGTKPRTGNSGHPCGPGERDGDGDGDGYCGER
ncbi:hydantoinase/oxoprolinase family protein [Pseudonocardia sp. MH-G8]|uniref:hydantoinase/oxoprolinase family protein n=1 Tax=Pseudonocardia sp. MH-G8 TaxID=1854588 RepID=UPI000B9FFABB|nr:hydantoinase/oxoprolinase family protein [Pseudonocardia sp. MH-G8]OZM80885.1 hypothetical protein CFP66_19375 [Pseudonocardia sp. MH-G8]